MSDEQEIIEQVAVEPPKRAYPKTMKRGPLAGQTFQTDGEYKAAMREVHANGVPKRRRGRPRKAEAQRVAKGGGTYRLQADLNGQKVVAEGPITQAQLIELIRLVAPKA